MEGVQRKAVSRVHPFGVRPNNAPRDLGGYYRHVSCCKRQLSTQLRSPALELSGLWTNLAISGWDSLVLLQGSVGPFGRKWAKKIQHEFPNSLAPRAQTVQNGVENKSKSHWEIKGRFRKRVVLANMPSFQFSFRGNMRMYSCSGFRSGGTSAKTTLLENHPLSTPEN